LPGLGCHGGDLGKLVLQQPGRHDGARRPQLGGPRRGNRCRLRRRLAHGLRFTLAEHSGYGRQTPEANGRGLHVAAGKRAGQQLRIDLGLPDGPRSRVRRLGLLQAPQRFLRLVFGRARLGERSASPRLAGALQPKQFGKVVSLHPMDNLSFRGAL